jgi:predicted helicase
MKNNKQAQVFHFDVFGKRQDKYDFLDNHSLVDIDWNELQPDKPAYFLVSKDFKGSGEYEMGFKLDKIFKIISSGIKTHDDGNLISLTKFNNNNNNNEIYYYRPFDIRNIDYDLNKVVRHRFSVLRNMLNNNIALLVPKQSITALFGFFVSKGLTDINYTGVAGQFGAGLVFPLYLYPETNAQKTIGQTTERTPNLNTEIVNQIAEKLGLTFVPEKEPKSNVCFINNPEVRSDFKTTFAPIDILDYIYAVLHSPTYREKYKEFLKIDFPRVPYPKDAETFWQLVELGGEIRQIHLLESQKVNQFITSYPNDGNNTVTRKMTTVSPGWEATNEEKTIGRVWINDQQYFDGVPLIAWEFYIGGYQPAQKWLKDRNGRILNFEDILHYQKIIVALTETHRLMQEVDKIGVE